MSIDNKTLLDKLKSLLNEQKVAEATKLLAQLHPADIADLFEQLDEAEKKLLFQRLDTDTASEVISELSEYSRDQIVAHLSHRQLGEIVDELDSDDAADLLAGRPQEMVEEVLAHVDIRDSRRVRRLLAYGEETAGGIMQAEYLAVPLESTVADAINHVREHGAELEGLANIFVVDQSDKVVGQLSLRKLILAKPEDKVSEVMDTAIHPIPVDMDQEDVARMFQKYDLISAPVVDHNGCLIGRITIDDIVDIIEEEVSEDVLRMAGTHEDELVYGDQIWKISRVRLPWLITNLFGGLLTGYLLWLFKVTLADAIVLVTFVPVITAMGGNVGLQSSSITVRGLATGQVDLRSVGRAVFKEVKVGLIMAAACGLTVGICAELWHHNAALGLTVGSAMAGAITVASFMGTVVPIMFKRFGIDPAVASGPFVTTANDITGILIYLSISTIFLKYIVS
ncbi:MAG: magnesium transporter [Deltaproteobacteria bacterium]|nr:magnesium transporter [Deltaproteobacteria bacterium]MBW2069952.1 magnesium transporter [Deltaproteobacteria bacterium]